jgi:predicted metal-binding protein
MAEETMMRVAGGTMQNQSALRTYRAPWRGQLVLVCRKCQKKLKHSGKKNGLAKLNKTLKKRARKDEDGPALHVVDVSCLKLCPKGGVTVCTERQLGRRQCSILYTNTDVDALLEQSKA